MSRRSLAAVLTAVLVLTLMPAASAAPPEQQPFERLSLDGVGKKFVPALADPDRLLTVMVQMKGQPIAVQQAQAAETDDTLTNRQKTSIRRTLRVRQNRITDEIQALGGEVQSQLQDAYNGIRVQIEASQIPELEALPNVRAVRELQTFEPTNAQSVPFLGTPGVWEDLGFTGQDVSIAVIDTGVDYTHANFGGPGDPAAFENNDPDVIEEGTFPTAKVVGGFDFVGDEYNAASDDPALSTPNPDPDPIDCNGHGSHVAGTAAGMGVLDDGSTYTGPYGESTHEQSFNVGPGVAPQASVYALKVFGCAGSSAVVADAIDWAVERGVDVINMSVGSPFGRPDDPTAVAASNAAAAGVVVVSSAGNAGPAPYITGSPASAPGTLSVAAMDAIATVRMAEFTSPAGSETLQNSNGADVTEPITGTVVVLEDDPETDLDESLGCDPDDYSEVQEGDIVVTFRGVCARVDRAIFGQEVDAAAVVMINTSEGYPPIEGPIPGVDIPFLGAMPEQAETLLASDGQEATITDAGEVPNPTFRQFAGFTSGGPRNGDSGMKPDLTAPGVGIASTFVGSGSGGIPLSGTSMAAPHVAGVAALVRDAQPDWDVPAVNAALTNTSDPDGLVGYSTRLGGAGLVQPQAAVTTPVVAVGNEDTGALSFGYAERVRDFSVTEQVTLHNTSDETVSFRPRVEWSADADGAATVHFSPRDLIRVRAGESRDVRVRIRVDVSDVPTGSDQAPADVPTASGNIVFDPVTAVVSGSGPEGLTELRTPFMLVPDAASQLRTYPERIRIDADQDSVSMTTRNRSPVEGTADVYAWNLYSGHDDDAWTTDVRAVGVQSFPEDRIGVFAINTHNRVSTPSINEWDVLLDTDDDGESDYAVVGFDVGAILAGAFNGQLGSFTIDLDTFDIVAAFFAGGGYDTSHVLLPFPLEAVGLSGDDADFDYVSAVFSLEGFPEDIVEEVASFDFNNPGVETGAFFEIEGRGRVSWEAGVDAEAIREHDVMGFMVVYANNRNGRARAQLVNVNPR